MHNIRDEKDRQLKVALLCNQVSLPNFEIETKIWNFESHKCLEKIRILFKSQNLYRFLPKILQVLFSIQESQARNSQQVMSLTFFCTKNIS